MHVEEEARPKFDHGALRSPRGRTGSPARTDARRAAAWRSCERNHLRASFLGSAFCGLAVAVAAYGLGEGRFAVAAFGVAGFVLVASAMAVAACASIRRLQRRCERLGRAWAESERARHDLRVANAELERRVGEFEAQQAAIVDGFEWVDEQTAGRLRALLEAAGLELADLADIVLEDEREAT